MTSFSEFGEFTDGSEVAAAFSEAIRGKYVLLVGVSPNSLGEPLALAIARHNPALLILASRSKDKIHAIVSKIKETRSKFPVEEVVVDLSSLKSVRRAAEEINDMTSKLDIVINNAAVNVQDYRLTSEGIEMHFGTNHVGLYLLTNMIMPKIRRAAKESSLRGATRIINMTSAGHRLSPIRFSDYNFCNRVKDLPAEERPPPGLPPSIFDREIAYSSFIAYGQSKTANILFSVYLNQHLKSQGIISYSVHPGSIWTGLARNLDEEAQSTIRKTGKNWKNLDQGAAPALVAAFDPALNEPAGVYIADCQFATAAEFATKEDMATRLWGLSEKLVGHEFNLTKTA